MSKKTPRPFVVCHMLCSLDGRISGKFYTAPGVEAAVSEYASLRSFYKCGATLYGATTAIEFAGGEAVKPEPSAPVRVGEDFFAAAKERDYIVAADTHGRIGWNSGTFKRPGRADAHIIEALTELVSPEYLAYLRRLGVSYVFAGKDKLDFAQLMQKLSANFGIERVMLAGGGLINGALLDAGVIDELSVVVAPAIDGGDGATLFSRCGSAGLQLIGSRRLDSGGMWLRYSVG